MSPDPATPSNAAPDDLGEAAERSDPIVLFERWFRAANEAGLALPEAVALATATPEGRPSVRTVLLKGVDPRGFVFFTNYGSRKAAELDANPHAALCAHWATLERQVRIQGPVTRVGPEESDEYFASRPLGSRIGAWASCQSRILDDRSELEARVTEIRERFGEHVPRPEFWGGYRLDPVVIEFWQGRPDRLHDRLVFQRDGDGWSTHRLYP